ncbi:hypothetical protein [Paraburkholderia pallida]|uniref:Uncharacterized protein n=1 Tax=Paraburkholderia pallida TaxID=2547399 RepID=A0A4P7CJS0_9BURK|nr:hypothetical protein [Paraburkholderia pallida]QBQ95920.1 hypothetical protein E1956_01140 [Paraburkholderia pallida]
MREYRDKVIEELAVCTCDRCGRRMTPDEPAEWYERVSLGWRCGFDSIFGDGARVSLDLCQGCVRDTLGQWLCIDAPDAPTDHAGLRGPAALTPVREQQVSANGLPTTLKGAVRHEGEAAGTESMKAAIAAAPADAGGGRQLTDATQPAPEFHWNYRVMEFHEGGETWREFREVYYRNGEPEGYSSVYASPCWDDDDEAARRILDRMRDALARPILRPGDFRRREEQGGAGNDGV